ncbi:MAG: rRNA maturation RNase YbeY [Gammaproteobacteria bacterium]|nr:rRNA maturation RNase YbeY [Gammaproteobacteria bacterium]MBU1655256.1 rRNA maturation RNase YbeY [Gammaproteobacteria bacterium]MBU1962035.1 rRNA maturation RNase YbeY [Gammaproteobacteria bacterium]
MVKVEIQRVSECPGQPADGQLKTWVMATPVAELGSAGLVIRIVDEGEGRELNHQYRGKEMPTNVLSFLFEAPPGFPSDYLGDLVICAPVVEREALEQGKAPEAHWTHLVVHGVLHLLGHDHQNDASAEAMEALEVAILARLGLPDPYEAC